MIRNILIILLLTALAMVWLGNLSTNRKLVNERDIAASKLEVYELFLGDLTVAINEMPVTGRGN